MARRAGAAAAAVVVLVLLCLTSLADAIRRVPPTESIKQEMQHQQQQQQGGGAEGKEWCLEAGFNPEQLKCSTCEKLAGVVLVEGEGDAARKVTAEGLVAECRQCCTEDDGAGAGKYVRATLELDNFFLSFIPEFKSLAGKDQFKAWEKSGALKIKRKSGARPSLNLYAEGQSTPGEIVSVATWTADSIIDFLQDNLAPKAAGSGEEEGGKKEGERHDEL